MSDITPAKLEESIVAAVGVGRADYSVGVEMAVESTIRSYQSAFSEWDTMNVAAGATETHDFAITSGKVVIVWDFYISVPANVLLNLHVQAVRGLVIGNILRKNGYGRVVEHTAKGFPFFEIVRFNVTNYGLDAWDVLMGCHGIETDEEEYYLRVTPAP